MISLSYNVRISLRRDYVLQPSLSEFQGQPAPPSGQDDYFAPMDNMGPQKPLWEAILSPKEDETASSVVEHSLSIESLNERVVTPFTKWGDIRPAGRTVPFAAIERIEIRAKGTDSILPSYLSNFLNRISVFEWHGTDVTKEFIKDPSPWGPSIGAPERPDMIPVDLLFERLVTDDRLSQATRTRFRSRNFADAVEAAFKCLDNTVKEKSGLRDKVGSDLMFTAFSEKNPLLRLNELSSITERNEQEGYKHLFAGAMKGIRNPRAHEHELIDDPKVALELLAFANHLMCKVGTATKNDTQSNETTP